MLQLSRPHKNLWWYYALCSLILGPFFFFMLIPLTFRFRTMRYEFDDEGVSMRWGVFFRREISLNYSRIQDIHLKSNLVQRWLGLGDVKLQTASGSASAEMTIEGFQEFEVVRDFLYSRMRGAKQNRGVQAAPDGQPALRAPDAASAAVNNEHLVAEPAGDIASADVIAELRAARIEMRRLADRLESLAQASGSVEQ